jgi:hypothetical protein
VRRSGRQEVKTCEERVRKVELKWAAELVDAAQREERKMLRRELEGGLVELVDDGKRPGEVDKRGQTRATVEGGKVSCELRH